MLPLTLSDEQWQKMLPILRSHPNAYVGQERECRCFLSAVLWISRSGAQWRLLPKEYGDWNAVYKRFSRWAQAGVFEQLHQFVRLTQTSNTCLLTALSFALTLAPRAP